MFSTQCNTKQNSKPSVKAQILGALGSITKCHVSVENSRLKRFDLLKHSQNILKNHRVCNCLKKRIDKNSDIGVFYNPLRSTAQFSNLQRCGSLWACPVCANQISQKRKQEVGQAVNAHRKNGGDVVMLTLTTPHQYHDVLDELLLQQSSARKRFWETTAVQNILKSWGSVGHITSLEITHGSNGWHPHYHILLFIRSGVDFSKQKAKLYQYWAAACVRSGLGKPNEKNGLDLRDGSHADKYITKWGLADEMTRSVVKVGKTKSHTPFDLLALAGDGCDKSKYLFMLYVAATRGKRQLMWSRGLKKRFGIDDLTDESIVNETEKVAEEVATLPPLVYYLLVRENKRPHYLTAIEFDVINHTNTAGALVNQLLQAEYDYIIAKKDGDKLTKSAMKANLAQKAADLRDEQIYKGLWS